MDNAMSTAEKFLWWVYIVGIVLTFGYGWERDCHIMDTRVDKNYVMSTGCGLLTGVTWPVYMTLKASTWALSPSSRLPKLEWK